MDVNLTTLGTALESLTNEVRVRVQFGSSVIRNSIPFFEEHLGNVPSSFKEDNTRVTPADLELSTTIINALKERFPLDHFCSEEATDDESIELKNRFTWMLDPVDGTNNYAMGLPACCISLGLLDEGMPIYGIIYDSLTKTLLQGGPSCGIWQEEQQIVLDLERPFTKHSHIALQFPFPEKLLKKLQPFLQTRRSRNFGSGALNLAYVAVGRFDGSISCNVKVWDIAAAYALLLASNVPFHFLGAPLFPLKHFHAKKAPFISYYAGSISFCEYMESLLNQES